MEAPSGGGEGAHAVNPETLRFIDDLYERERKDIPATDHDSFVAGAKAVVEHMINRL